MWLPGWRRTRPHPPPEGVGGLHDGPVAGDARQRAEGIEGLRTRDWWHHVHAEGADVLGSDPPRQTRVLLGAENGDQRGTPAHLQQLCVGRRSDGEHDITIPGISDDHSPDLTVGVVIE